MGYELSEYKAYACLEPYESTGAIIFARSNIEARRWSANEFHDDDIGGMSVKRAPWADKYGSRGKIPIADMVDHGWNFECMWSGNRIDSDLYENPREKYNEETKTWEEDDFFIGFGHVIFIAQDFARIVRRTFDFSYFIGQIFVAGLQLVDCGLEHVLTFTQFEVVEDRCLATQGSK